MAAEKKESETFDEASKDLQKYIDELMKKLEPSSPANADSSDPEGRTGRSAQRKETKDDKREKVHAAVVSQEPSPATPTAAAGVDERLAKIEKKVNELEKIAKKIGELKKADDFATKEDVKRLEDKIMGIPKVVNGLVEIQRSLVSLQQKHHTPSKPAKYPQPKRNELTREREKLLKLMENAENEYKEGLLSKESYEEIKQKNEHRLSEIQKLLGQ